ncbi:hypothetical protein DFH05DRAFT_435720 [Lentinula detonsa]|uniref:BTB domain-containing protein n=1 Tax=Lentinula detonsa TaxID=2804962 RepID=A0A9W8NTR9_9AGAR|nr:hypothetical protein DFH05DRAFT_435720 [Lentinula detonsa]
MKAERDGYFWFYDGSIVVQAQDKLFRVHQTVLANSSEIFSTLFSLPPSDSDTQDLIEGCPVVQIQDLAQDFSDILRALYNPHFDDFPSDSELEDILNFISGTLRLSSKYMIHSLRRKCITLFTRTLPATLEGYDSRTSRETNVTLVLPFAYYCIARLPSRRILEENSDDISWQQKTICLVGRERLRYAEMSLSHSFLLGFQPASTCSNVLCTMARGPHTEWHLIEASRHPHPLRPYNRWNALNVCPECVANAKKQHTKGRQEVWNCLPAFFELRSWEELRTVYLCIATLSFP